jgi:hypothetical protein
VPTRDHFWRRIPLASQALFLVGVFFIFSIIGSAVDSMGMGLPLTTRRDCRIGKVTGRRESEKWNEKGKT